MVMLTMNSRVLTLPISIQKLAVNLFCIEFQL